MLRYVSRIIMNLKSNAIVNISSLLIYVQRKQHKRQHGIVSLLVEISAAKLHKLESIPTLPDAALNEYSH